MAGHGPRSVPYTCKSSLVVNIYTTAVWNWTRSRNTNNFLLPLPQPAIQSESVAESLHDPVHLLPSGVACV